MTDPLSHNDLTVTVEDLAEWLVLTPTRVQQLAKKGIVARDEHGVYRLKASVQGYIREINAKADGKNSEYHKHRTELMKVKAQDAKREYAERMGLLVNAEAKLRADQKKFSDIKQRLVALEKTLPPRTGGLPGSEQVPIIRHEIRKILIELAAADGPGAAGAAGVADLPAPAGPDRQPVGGPEPQAQQ